MDLIRYDGSNTCAERRQFARSFQLLTTEDNLQQCEKTLFDILTSRFAILRPKRGQTLQKSPKLLPLQCEAVFVCFAGFGLKSAQSCQRVRLKSPGRNYWLSEIEWSTSYG